MSHRAKSANNSRRDFLLKGVVAVGGAATLAAVGKSGAVEKSEVKPKLAAAAPQPKGYRETPHIREYYHRARF
jgi:nitrous oxide reductase